MHGNQFQLHLFDSKSEGGPKCQGFTPISLTTSLYKVIAEVLSNRMKEVLSGITKRNQSAFVKGRYIQEEVLITNEVVEDRKAHRREGLTIKLDLEKACDHVTGLIRTSSNSRWLAKVCRKWISWVLGCISSSHF